MYICTFDFLFYIVYRRTNRLVRFDTQLLVSSKIIYSLRERSFDRIERNFRFVNDFNVFISLIVQYVDTRSLSSKNPQ